MEKHIAELYEEGRSQREVLRLLHSQGIKCSFRKLKKIFIRNGVRIRGKKAYLDVSSLKRKPWCRFSIPEELGICALYKLIGMNSLAAMFLCSREVARSTIHFWSKYGIVKVRRPHVRENLIYIDRRQVEPPLTSIVKQWKEEELINEFPKLVCVLLQTDGTGEIKKGSIAFYNKNKILHDIFVDLMWFAFELKPSLYLQEYGKKSKVFRTLYAGEKYVNAIRALLKICRSFKTSPAHTQSIEEYLGEPQPELDYLLCSEKRVQIIAARLAMSTEGSITITLNKGNRWNNYAYPRIELMMGCTHPKLAYQWKELMEKLGMSFSIRNSPRYWSRVMGIRSNNLQSIQRFYQFGGFIEGVKISTHSKIFSGVEKQKVLRMAVTALMHKKFPKDIPQSEFYYLIKKHL